VVDKGRVLLVKRGHAPLRGQWSIPGGMLELGESLRQAAQREAWEETGLEVEATDLLGVFERIVLDRKKRTRYHYVLVDFLCRRTGGVLGAAADADEARWFRPQQLANLDLPADTRDVIRLGIEKAAESPGESTRVRSASSHPAARQRWPQP
jgi:8-oxo-dGTP diphosphatase